ncbi:MAG: methyltransferase domain-containing protein [Patescibacteria group bacterium]
MLKALQIIICPTCRQHLSVAQVYTQSAVLRCRCANYPLVAGILYLHKNPAQKHAVTLLQQGRSQRAFGVLCDTKKPLSLLLSFLWHTQLIGKLGFTSTLHLLNLFSFPHNWAWYLRNRQRLPSYYLIKYSIALLAKRRGFVVEIGCGVGQIFPLLYERLDQKRVCGIDKSFINLLLARAFFAKPETLLLCADVEKGIPLKTHAVDLVLASDSFHYIHQKRYFLQEASRATTSSGRIALVHVLNNPGSFSAEKGIGPAVLRRLLKINRFSQQTFLTNPAFWSLIRFSLPVRLGRSDPPQTLLKEYAYSVLAAKKNLTSPKDSLKNFSRAADIKSVVYQNDPQLKSVTSLPGLLWAFDHFLFVSPHLDDAVLSCGLLLQQVVAARKKLTVATIFTQGDPQINSPFVKLFLGKCGFTDANNFFRERRREDQAAMAALKARLSHAGFTDAAWRINPATHKPLYPTQNQLFSGKPASQDKNLLQDIGDALKKLVLGRSQEKILLLAPLGVGGHIDHVLVRQAVSQLIKIPTLYWEDFPYNTQPENPKSFFGQNPQFSQVLTLDKQIQKKVPLIKFYRSQLKALFPRGDIPLSPEKYYKRDPETLVKT